MAEKVATDSSMFFKAPVEPEFTLVLLLKGGGDESVCGFKSNAAAEERFYREYSNAPNVAGFKVLEV